MVAKDPTACLPQDIVAWGRLAHELLVQAARDATWKSRRICKHDKEDALAFFYSTEAEYVWWRETWFTLAGMRVPEKARMEVAILTLCGKKK